MLSLEKRDGRKMSAKEYLETALQLQDGISDKIQKKNQIRKKIRFFFQSRDCMTFVRPVDNENDLKRLNSIKTSLLRPQFNKQIQLARKKIFKNIKVKQIENREVNGFILLEATEAYLQTINEGRMPNIKTAWEYIARESVASTLKRCREELKRQLSLKPNKTLFLQDQKTWEKQIRDSLTTFYCKAIVADQELREEGQRKLNELLTRELALESEKTTYNMKQNIGRQFSSLFFNIKERIVKGDIVDLRTAKLELERGVKESLQGGDGGASEQIIQEYIQKQEREILEILL
jgi:hypothetical protein